MDNVTIGYLYGNLKFSKEDEIFIELAKKKGISLVLLNTASDMGEGEIEKKAEPCDLIFNNTAGEIAIEVAKTFEELGKQVIENTKIYYYTENKWMFYVKCRKNKILTPKTILLPYRFSGIKKELIEFNQWPVVLKKTSGEQGEFVERAVNIEEAINIIEKFWEKSKDRAPIIAQEFVKSKSYRVTVVGDKILQTTLKDGHGWKSTGMYAEKLERFELDEKLEKIVQKIIRVVKMGICGIDFMKRDDEWLAIEVNAEPSFELLEEDTERIISEVLDFLKKQVEDKRVKLSSSQDKSSQISESLLKEDLNK